MKTRKLVNCILGLLILQFVLGMLANLYSTIPDQKAYEVFQQFGYIAFHAVNGTLLLILGVIFAVKMRKERTFKAALGGVINLALAFAFGEFFVFTQQDIFSFLMALSFIGAMMSYAKVAFSDPN